MKYTGFIIIVLVSLAFCGKRSKAVSQTQDSFSENESKVFASYAKMITCATKPLEKSCPSCVSKKAGFKLFFFYQSSRLLKYKYKFMIHYNDEEKKVLISMAGPSVKEYPRYVQLIYTQGFSWVSSARIQIESEYKKVYYSRLRGILLKKIAKIKKSGRGKYQFVFTGHSIGASLATLAAYDLTSAHVLSKSINHTRVFSYGGLRIGDQRFVTLVNSSMYVYRIIRSDDFVVRIPNCYYSITALGWRCFTQDIINRYIVVPTSPLFFYLQNYRYSYYYRVPVVQSVRTFIAWRKNHPSTNHRAVKRHENSHNHHGMNKHNLPNHTQELRTHREEKLPSHQERMRDIFKREEHRLRWKKMENNNRRPMHNMAHNNRHLQFRKSPFKREDPRAKKFKINRQPIQPIQPQHNRHRDELIRKNPVHNLKPLHERLPKNEIKEDNRLSVSKPLPEIRKSQSNQTPKGPNTNNQKYVTNNKPSVINLPKLHITPTAANTYYYQYVYYTQPFGSLYYYPASWGAYSVCSYINFVSACERRIVLPATFTIGPHLVYYNIDFNVCDE